VAGGRADGGAVSSSGPPSIGVVGLGLIGGSLARRLVAEARPAVGWDADAGTRAAARAAGLPVASSLAALAEAGGVVVIAVPLPAVDDVLAAVAAAAPPGTVVTDTTSVKEPVRALAARHRVTFVGGHPMAGTAESGFGASSAELLAGATWALTLDDETDLADWMTIAGVVMSLGCAVVPMTSAAHDHAVAAVSHLPHVLAAALVLGAADPLARTLAAGSFRDATRVATTRAELVAAMCAGNADALESQLTALGERLMQVGQLLRQPAGLTRWFASAREARVDWPDTAGREMELTGAGLRARLLAAGLAGGRVVAVGPDRVLVRTAVSADEEQTGTPARGRGSR